MPRVRLTRAFITGLAPPARETLYHDTDAPGLALRHLPSGQVRWLYIYRRRGQGRKANPTKLLLGAWPGMTLAQARDLASQHRATVLQGGDPRAAIIERSQAPTLRQFAETCQTYWSSAVKPRTAFEYTSVLQRHVLPRIGHVPVPELRPDHVLEMAAELGQTRTCGKAIATLHRMMELAERPGPPWRGLRPQHSNPCHGVEIFKGRPAERRYSDAELAAIWAAITRLELAGGVSLWAAGCLRCLMLTLVREADLAGDRRHPDKGAHWSRLDEEAMTLTIVDHKTSRKRGPKVIALDARVLTEIRRMPHVGPYIFASRRFPERPIGASGIAKAFSEVRAAAGIEHGTIHALRHTMAGIADDIGMPLGTIAAGLGHASERTTETFYRDSRRLKQARLAQQAFAEEMSRRVAAGG